ncbi:MAG: aminoacyl-tRNA hydrolase [Myxococcales bacterium]|nr:aminoacyl-tRNA hydrolase [Myxococcales bacterium]
MEAPLPIDARLTIPGDELAVSTSRAGGPGGQHVNTTDSRVTLRWNVRTSVALPDEARAWLLAKLAARLTLEGEVMVSVSDERSQLLNRQLARERLAALIRAARVVPKARRPTRPTWGSRQRRLTSKKSRSDRLQARHADE